MGYLNDWHDWIRVVVLIVSLYNVVTLLARWRAANSSWNEKTIDYWYAFFIWSIVGTAGAIQGIVLDRPFTPAFVFLCAATLVTGRGLHRKGSWGGNA